MSNKSDENITEYVQPVFKSTTGYDLLESYKYQIGIPDDTGNSCERVIDIVNMQDVLSIIMTVQIESTLIFIEKLLEDDKVVMTSSMEESFTRYARDIRRVIDERNKNEEES